MAFDARDFSILAYANGFTLWHYATPDLCGAVTRRGYFDEAHDLIEAGDMIMAHTGAGEKGASASILLVAANGGGGVAVRDVTGSPGGNGKGAA